MWHLALLFWISGIATLTKGQGVFQPQPAPPRIVGFFEGNLIKPEVVKSGKKFDASKNWGFRLPCDALGDNPLEWRWQHNETDITFPSAKYTLGADGSLTGSYLEAENSGNYQCFVKDPTANKKTFSRKVQVAVTYADYFVTNTDIAQTVKLGDPFSFNCPPHGGSYGASYTWANKGYIELNRDEHIAITPVGALHIMFITQADVDKISELKGIACTIVAANTIYQSGFLTVTRSHPVDPGTQKSPVWEVNSLSKSLEIAVEGRNKTLYCLAFGRPAPKITWKKDGQQITKGQNSYDIPDIFFGRQLKIIDVKKDKHESTKYTCEAENSMNSGNPLSHKINLKVEVAPRWRIKAPTWKLEVDIQGNGSLLCDVYADPVPSFKWYKDGKRILSSNQYVIIDDDKLRIQNATLQEDGVYQCVAENKHGMIVSSTWIYIGATTASPSPSHSLGATTRSPITETDKFSAFVSTHMETRSLQTRPALRSSGPILPSTSKAELESFSPVNSEETSSQVTNTGIPTLSSSPSSLSSSSSSLSGSVHFGHLVLGSILHKHPPEILFLINLPLMLISPWFVDCLHVFLIGG